MIRPLVCADGRGMAALIVRAIDQDPRTPAVRISAKVIFVGPVRAGMAHDCADLVDREVATASGRGRGDEVGVHGHQSAVQGDA